jgi:hypothetical protein
MTRRAHDCRLLAALLLIAATGLASAQSPGIAPPDAAAAGQPAAAPPGPAASGPTDRRAVLARVIEVRGDVQYALIGSSEWKPCQLNDEYGEQTKVRTGLRSSIKFQIGQEPPYTALVVESVGLVSLSELYKTEQTKRVRIGVGHGKIRAGVAEGGLRSEFTVDSPVATLSKRGTWNFGLAYERGTDRFEVFLLDSGLVDALHRLSGKTIELLPGEAVTEAMRAWLDEVQVRENVAVADLFGQEHMQVAFNTLDNSGLGVLGPGGGRAPLLNLSSGFAQQSFAQTLQTQLAQQGVPPTPGILRVIQNPPPAAGPNFRPEGFFGTGRGDELLEVTLDRQNELVRRGLAKPGRFLFRRSALESWLAARR